MYKAFLRGFFDRDGCNSGMQVFACNSNRGILVYVKQLLQKIGVRTGKISIDIKAGTEHRKRSGEIIKPRKTAFDYTLTEEIS